jgi:hypothetical protein
LSLTTDYAVQLGYSNTGLYGAYIYGGATLILYGVYMGTQHIILGSYYIYYLSTQSTTIRTSTTHGVNIIYIASPYKIAYSHPARSQQYYVQRPYGPITRHLQVLSTSYLSHPSTYIIYIYYYHDCSLSYSEYIILGRDTWQ